MNELAAESTEAGGERSTFEISPCLPEWKARWSWVRPEEAERASAVWGWASADLPAGEYDLVISAAHHYRLFLDGNPMGRGPDRADPRYPYFKRYPFRSVGNTYAISVLVYHFQAGCSPTRRDWCLGGGPPGVIAEIRGTNGDTVPLVWIMKRSEAWHPRPPYFSDFLGPVQEVDLSVLHRESDDMFSGRLAGYSAAHTFDFGHGGFYPVPLPAEIPDLLSVRKRPTHVSRLAVNARVFSGNQRFLAGHPPSVLTVSKESKGSWLIFEFDSPFCGFPILELEGEGVVDVYVGEGRSFLRQDRLILSSRQRILYEGMAWRGGTRLALDCSGLHDDLKLHRVEINDQVYPFSEVGSFRCDHSEWNQLWDACRKTAHSGVRDHPMDCVFREQALWLEDLLCHSRAVRACFGDLRPFTKALLQLFRVMHDDGSIPVPGPAGLGYDRKSERLRWSCKPLLVPILLCDQMQWSPDAIRQEKSLPNRLERLAAFYHGYETEDGWLATSSPGKPELDSFFGWNPSLRTGIPTDLNAAYSLALHALSELASLFGRKEHARLWARKSRRVAALIRKHCWIRERGLFANGLQQGKRVNTVSPTVNGWCALAGLLPRGHAGIWAHAMETDEGLLPPVTPYDASILLLGFARYDLPHQVRALLNGYFGSIIRAGHTTLPEYWQEHDHGAYALGDDSSRSHAFGAAPVVVFHEYILGVRPQSAGWKDILISPRPVGLNHASGTIPSPRGAITVQWERSDTAWGLRLTLPAAMRATIEVPRIGCGTQSLEVNGHAVESLQHGITHYSMAAQDPDARLRRSIPCRLEGPGAFHVVTRSYEGHG